MKTSHTTTSARSARLLLVAGIAVATAATLHSSRADAASQTWDGGAGTNILNTATNWTNDSLPTAANDTATFGTTASGTLQWNANFGPTSGNAGGVNISYTGVNALTLDATNTTTFGLGDITLAAGAGIFALGDGTGTSSMTIRDSSMTFTNDSSNNAVAKSDVVFGNGGGSPRTIAVAGSGSWTFETPLFSAGFGGLSSSALTKSGNGTLTLGTQNFHQGATTVNAGIILATASSALGAGTVSLPNPSGRVQLSGGITLPNAFSIPGQNQGDIGKLENLSGNNTLSGTLTWNSTGGSFTNITSTSGTLTLTGNLTTAGGVTGDRTFQFGGSGDTVSSGTISNGAATTLNVLKSGAGTLTLSGNNTFTGATTLAAGRLALGSTNAIGTVGPIAFTGGTLQYSASNTADYSSRIASGTSAGSISVDTNGQNVTFGTSLTANQSGGLTKVGSGTLVLTASNTFGGNTTVSGGILGVQNSNALSIGSVSVGGARVQLSGGVSLLNNFALAGAINGPTDSLSFSRIENLSGNNTIAGNITWNQTGGTYTNITSTSGTLTLSGSLNTSGGVTGDRTFNFNGNGDTTISGPISNGVATTLNVLKSGTGTLTLSGSSSYNGITTLAAGRLALGSDPAIGTVGPIAFAGGTLQYSASNTADYSSRIASGTSTGSVAIDTNGQTVTFASGLTASQSGGLSKVGSGKLVLTASNAFGGGIAVSDGLLEVQHSNALSGGTVTTGAGRLQLSGGIALANAFSLNGATNGPTDSLIYSRIENLSGNNTISGNMTWNQGGGTHTNISSSAGTLTLSGNLTTASISGSRTFNFTGSGDTIISGQISDGVGSTVGLTKNGSGSLTISGSGNTYSGPTTVTVGRLVVNGNLPSATTTVQAGATIGGNGSLGGLLAVDSGAFLAPGNSPGNLTLNAGLNLAGTYSWELAALSTSNPGVDFDTITVTAGNVDLTGATLALNLGGFAPSADAFWATNQTWNGIIANTGAGTLAGAFAAIDNSSWSSLGSFSAVSIDNDVNLVWTAVPEPGASVLAVLGAIGLGIALRRSRR
jgi:autotransporter-associated beta strand protein